MAYLIHGLDPALFAHASGVRKIADSSPGYPCRVSLADAEVGDELLLVHFEHHATSSPYRASGPIFVRRTATEKVVLDRVPDVLARRLISVRGYDAAGMMEAADVVDGRELAARLDALLDRRDIAYVHLHYARPGCYAARVERA